MKSKDINSVLTPSPNNIENKMTRIIFLGTSCMVPTKKRNHPSVYVNHSGQGFLFDCGENTQRQMKIAGIRPSSIRKIFLSHWHADHVLGIPGLFYSLRLSDYKNTLEIYGPKGTRDKIKDLLEIYGLSKGIAYKVIEVEKEGTIYEGDFIITAKRLNHTIDTFGYSFIEGERRKIDLKKIDKAGIPKGPLWGRIQGGKSIRYKGKRYLPDDLTKRVLGNKITYITDTVFDKRCAELAKDSDILIIESTYEKKDKNKAIEFSHMTSEEAAAIGKLSNSKKVILFHFSQRYRTANNILKEANAVFKNCIEAKDFLIIDL